MAIRMERSTKVRCISAVSIVFFLVMLKYFAVGSVVASFYFPERSSGLIYLVISIVCIVLAIYFLVSFIKGAFWPKQSQH